MPDVQWEVMVRELYGPEAVYTMDATHVLRRIVLTNTCSSITSPVSVWIDPDGVHTVLAYEADGRPTL